MYGVLRSVLDSLSVYRVVRETEKKRRRNYFGVGQQRVLSGIPGFVSLKEHRMTVAAAYIYHRINDYQRHHHSLLHTNDADTIGADISRPAESTPLALWNNLLHDITHVKGH